VIPVGPKASIVYFEEIEALPEEDHKHRSAILHPEAKFARDSPPISCLIYKPPGRIADQFDSVGISRDGMTHAMIQQLGRVFITHVVQRHSASKVRVVTAQHM
jgi:hypothetical protein